MKKPLACWGFALALLCSQKDANGDAVVTLSPADDNVVVEGGGTLNLAALTFDRTATLYSDVDPSAGTIILGPPHPSDLSMYTGLNMPRAFGGGGEIIADFVSGSGDLFGIGIGQSFLPELLVPAGYVSGSTLSGKSTWSTVALDALDLTPGTYVWTWGTGGTADSFTLNILNIENTSPAPVPEPGTYGLFALTGLGVMAFRRIRG